MVSHKNSSFLADLENYLEASLFGLIGNMTHIFSGLNPYIYFAFNLSFRKACRALFVHCSRKVKIHRVMIPFRPQSVELQSANMKRL